MTLEDNAKTHCSSDKSRKRHYSERHYTFSYWRGLWVRGRRYLASADAAALINTPTVIKLYVECATATIKCLVEGELSSMAVRPRDACWLGVDCCCYVPVVVCSTGGVCLRSDVPQVRCTNGSVQHFWSVRWLWSLQLHVVLLPLLLLYLLSCCSVTTAQHHHYPEEHARFFARPTSQAEVHRMFIEQLQRQERTRGGTWGEWSSWTACSRSCGGGVSIQSRECLMNPRHGRIRSRRRTADNAKVENRCVGLYKRFQLCNTKDCSSGYTDFRREQCASFNKTPFNRRFYTWEPYYDTPDSCALNCRAVGLSFYATLNQTVIDGTTCGVHGSNRICVIGRCMEVGCDGVLGSGLQLDSCGHCGGNNSTCRVIAGVFSRPKMPFGYNLIATLPRGAANITIQHAKPSTNYLALRQPTGEFFLNGDWAVNSSGNYPSGGTTFSYQRPERYQGDKVTAIGPLTQPVDVMLFYQSPNPGIRYEYRLPMAPSSSKRLSGSVVPGSPQRRRRPDNPLNPLVPGGPASRTPPSGPVNDARSVNGHGNSVLSNRRWEEEEEERKKKRKERRGKKNHRKGAHGAKKRKERYEWKVVGFSTCTETCGGGTQTSRVVCVKRKRGNEVPASQCRDLTRPAPEVVRCNLRPCPAAWVPEAWGPCSVTCGLGVQTRVLACKMRISPDQYITQPEGACLTPPTVPKAQVRWPTSVLENIHRKFSKVVGKIIYSVRDGAIMEVNDSVDHSFRKLQSILLDKDMVLECKEVSLRLIQVMMIVDYDSSSKLHVTKKHNTVLIREIFVKFKRYYAVYWMEDAHTSPKHLTIKQQQHKKNKKNMDQVFGRCMTFLLCGWFPQELCDMGSCATDTWFFSAWEDRCSEECGDGVQRRRVHCSGDALDNQVTETSCDSEQRPTTTRACTSDRGCGGKWFTGPWGECSSECGPGLRTRPVICVVFRGRWRVTTDVSQCKGHPRPESTEACTRPCSHEWYTSEWSQCSVSCGSGVQRREVKCLDERQEPALDCTAATKPDTRQPCNTQSCHQEQADESVSNISSRLEAAQRLADASSPGGETTDRKPSGNVAQAAAWRPPPQSLEAPSPGFQSPGENRDNDEGTSRDSVWDSASTGGEEEEEEEEAQQPSGRSPPSPSNRRRRPVSPNRPGRPWRPGLSTGSCMDRMKNCHLVYKARLCRLRYYNKLCCATCTKNQ
ncbi:thrombospondin type-1 domain-containing protein 4-like [Panulirus ornatus]|uniref:thrombospondin type-1 domain-containing protein 4-like n=1 Tax=Panulirus ornatus TaxID=150431 RepID=UPI003A895B7C